MKKLLVFVIVLLLTTLLLTPFITANSDKDKPLQATNVELVKKITVRGKPQGGKPSKDSATGILGIPCSGNKYAIVIGISDYPGNANDLQYADDDAESMSYALTNLYGYLPQNIHLLEDMNATYDNILAAVNDVKNQAGPNDEIFFFFSGHGAKGVADDGDSEKIDESIVSHNGFNLVFIWDGQLKTWFKDFPSRIIFVFDSCVAGGMTDLKDTGRVINMATTESGTGYEFDSLEHGQFSYYFVNEGMIKGKADKYDHNGDYVQDGVTIEEAFDYARANCIIQKPTISDSFENDLLP
jgi:hypothetical protein